MRERERGLRRRRDAGQDASGTHRDIARDVRLPPEMLFGARTSCAEPWRFVLGCLSKKRGSVDPSPRVKILDTVLMESTGGGRVDGSFFTADDGTVKGKAERFLGCVICLVYRMLTAFTHTCRLSLTLNAKLEGFLEVRVSSRAEERLYVRSPKVTTTPNVDHP